MPLRDLIVAWVALIALSLGTLVLATAGTTGRGATIIAAGVLALAGFKARVILTRYLGLQHSLFWRRSFDLAIGLFLALSFALHTIGSGG
ncbi:hypothetical protein [Hyphomicrobium sp. 1Nfss2.1]|uniref:hypothetical protein n=1 Tax=Hyphomicrobium sp. 1Nfss2.1 TaxID=3413936 RepID=UPI003C7B614D